MIVPLFRGRAPTTYTTDMVQVYCVEQTNLRKMNYGELLVPEVVRARGEQIIDIRAPCRLEGGRNRGDGPPVPYAGVARRK